MKKTNGINWLEKIYNAIMALGNATSPSGSQEESAGTQADIHAGGAGPLIIEGTLEDQIFTPNEDQPAAVDAMDAVAEGRDVIIKMPNADGYIYYHWTECNITDGYMKFGDITL